MEAVILAGGLGSRLWPLTARRPKHLLPVGGVPFLLHQITKLAAAGVDHVVLATSYRAADFEPVLGDGGATGVRISYVTEDEPLGTGGGLRNAAAALHSEPAQPVVVLNGDQLSNHDIARQLARLADPEVDGCLHLIDVADPTAYGCVPTDADGRIVAFVEKSPDPMSRQINAGCYVLRRRIIDAIPAGQVVSIERETFPGLLDAGRVLVGYRESAYWQDVGTPKALVEASCDLVRGIASSPAYPAPPSERSIDESAEVDPDLVHGGSVIGPGVRIGPEAVVDGSVVMEGAQVEAGAEVIGSVVGPKARIGAGTRLRNAAVGDAASVGADCELLDGVRVGCDVVIPDVGVRFSPR